MMHVILTCVIASVLFVGGCGGAEEAAQETPAENQNSSESEGTEASEPPPSARCVPAAGCNMFLGCATVTDLIQRYEMHPNLEGQPATITETCWAEADGSRACVDALAVNLPCTPTPNEQMRLEYRCFLRAGECVAEPEEE